MSHPTTAWGRAARLPVLQSVDTSRIDPESLERATQEFRSADKAYAEAKERLRVARINLRKATDEALGIFRNLTQREQQVLRLIIEGQSNKEIAASLSVCERTVKYHVGSLLRKFDVKNRMELP